MPPSPSRPITEPSQSSVPSPSLRESTSLRKVGIFNIIAERELPKTPRASPSGLHLRIYYHQWLPRCWAAVRYRSGFPPWTLCPSTQSLLQGTRRERICYWIQTCLKTLPNLTGLKKSLQNLGKAIAHYSRVNSTYRERPSPTANHAQLSLYLL